MTVSTAHPIDRAIVRTIRAGGRVASYTNPEGDQPLTGKWLHEAFAPEKRPYPIVTYQRFPSTPRIYLWGSMMIVARYDIKVFSPSSVEAHTLDALIATELDEAELPVAGQSTLICRRMADLGSPDVDEEGTKIYMVGGTYEVITDQPLPTSVIASFTLDAVLA